MYKFMTAISVAAVLGLSGQSIAQEAQVDVNAGAEAGAAIGDQATGAAVSGDVNVSSEASPATHDYDRVMASLDASANLDLTSITDESSLQIVTISSLEGDGAEGVDVLDAYLAGRANEQEGLRTRLAENAAISAKLEAEGYEVEDVVSIAQDVDGTTTIYVDDRA